MLNIFSKRAKNPPIEVTFVIPPELRRQIVMVFQEIGEVSSEVRGVNLQELASQLGERLAEEYGQFHLIPRGGYRACDPESPMHELVQFLQTTTDERVLDSVEMMFAYLNSIVGNTDKETALIEKLNYRFSEHNVGYSYKSHQIFRIDSAIVHREITVPSLDLLLDVRFAGANDEMLTAYSHHRSGQYKEAIMGAARAFESTMKSICTIQGWGYDKDKATASQLVAILFQNNFIPAFLEAHFGALRSLLDGGLTTLRNRKAGHGQGEAAIEIPAHLSQYALNLASSNIIFLIENLKTFGK